MREQNIERLQTVRAYTLSWGQSVVRRIQRIENGKFLAVASLTNSKVFKTHGGAVRWMSKECRAVWSSG